MSGMQHAACNGRSLTALSFRKTGVTLRDTGVRDEHGMEPIDNIFSSPNKGNSDDGDEEEEEDEEEGEEADDDDDDDDDDEDGEAPMDLTTGKKLRMDFTSKPLQAY